MKRYFPVVFLLALCALRVSSQSSKILRSRQIGFEGQILSRLFAEYDENTRPPVRDTAEHSSIVVILSLFINRIVWHDHYAEVDLYLRQQWQDQRLMYDVDVREAIDEVVVPNNKRIWMPDTYVTNGDDTRRYERKRIVVEPSGFVRASEMRTVKVGVQYGDNFPFVNSRKFKLKISSYNYPIEDISYLWAHVPPAIVPIEVSKEVMDGPYQFKEAITEDCVGNYTLGIYSCIEAVVVFSGTVCEPIFRVFIPSIFLIIASWLHFWVHGSWSVPRSLSAAVPFFLFAALLVFYPQPYLAVAGVGGIQVWFVFCLLITFASLVEYFLVICCGVRRTIRYPNGTISVDDSEKPLATSARGVNEVVYDNTKCANFKQNNGIDVVSRIAFPVVFLIFLIVFLIYYLI